MTTASSACSVAVSAEGPTAAVPADARPVPLPEPLSYPRVVVQQGHPDVYEPEVVKPARYVQVALLHLDDAHVWTRGESPLLGDSSNATTSTWGEVVLWERSSGRELARLPSLGWTHIAVLPEEGALIGCAEASVLRFRLSDLAPLSKEDLEPGAPLPPECQVREAALPEGVSVEAAGDALVLRSPDAPELRLRGHATPAFDPWFAEDSARLNYLIAQPDTPGWGPMVSASLQSKGVQVAPPEWPEFDSLYLVDGGALLLHFTERANAVWSGQLDLAPEPLPCDGVGKLLYRDEASTLVFAYQEWLPSGVYSRWPYSLVDLTQCELLGEAPSDTPLGASADGQTLYWADPRGGVFTSKRNGKRRSKLKMPWLVVLGNPVFNNLLLTEEGALITLVRTPDQDGVLARVTLDDGALQVLSEDVSEHTRLSLSPDGQRLALIDFDRLRVIDAMSGALIFAADVGANGARFSPDGRLLASTHDTGAVRLWEAETGQLRVTLYAFTSGDWVAIDPQGRFDRSRPDLPGVHFVIAHEGQLESLSLEQLERYYYEPRLLEKSLDPAQSAREVVGFDTSQLPPSVRWELQGGQLRVQVEDRGGGVGRIALLVDGREVVADLRPEGWSGEGPFEVDLSPHARFLHADATVGLQGWSRSERVSSRGGDTRIPMDLLEDEGAETSEIDLYALVVGTGEYADAGLNLRYPDDDALAIAQALRVGGHTLLGEQGGEVHVTLLSTGGEHPQPDQASFEEAFAQIQAQSGPEDILIVYLSGHGVSVEGRYHYPWPTAARGDLSDPALLATRALTQERLMDLIRGTPAAKRLLVLDTCESGAFGARSNLASDAQKRALTELRGRMGLVVLAGAPAAQKAYERDDLQHGLLTYALLEGMRGEAPLQDGRYWDVDALARYAVERVPQLAQQLEDAQVQEPVMTVPTSSRGFIIGQLPPDPEAVASLRALDVPLIVGGHLVSEDALIDTLDLSYHLDRALSDLARTQTAHMRWQAGSVSPTAWRVGGIYAQRGERLELALSAAQLGGAAHRVVIRADANAVEATAECAALWVDRVVAFEESQAKAPPKEVEVAGCGGL